MRKIFFAIVSVFISSSIFGQNRINNTDKLIGTTFNVPQKDFNRTFNKASISDWYSPFVYAALDTVIGNYLTHSIGLIQSDSVAKIVYANGSADHNSWLSFGRVMDPKDTVINFTSNPQQRLSSYSDYTFDSIRFTYAYVRNTDSLTNGSTKFAVTDTLFITYFMGNEISKFSFLNTLNKYALVNWKGDSTRFPATYFLVDTIYLSRNDSTGIADVGGSFENFINLKLFVHKISNNIFVSASSGGNSNNLVAYTLTFKSGIQTVIGTDTAMMLYQLNPSTLPAGTRRTNYFGFYYAQNAGTTPWQNPTYYNTSLLVPWWSAYDVTSDWYGFVPGNAYTNEYFIDADFHLSSLNAGIDETKNGDFALRNLSPNPVKVGGSVSIKFNLQAQSRIKIEVFNLMGQLVKTVPNKKYNSGENAVNITVDGLNAGMYFVNIEANGYMQTQKLSIVE